MDKFDTFHQCFLYKIVIPVHRNAFMAIITGRVAKRLGQRNLQFNVAKCTLHTSA